jgi:hypothetical protein
MIRTTPRLSVVPVCPPSVPQPPGQLDQVGMALWISIASQYEFDDPGSIEILHQACLCRQRAERCRKLIDQQGEMLISRTGPRSHPLLRDELQNRALCARLIQRLGLDLEPIHDRPGRPSGR